MGSLVGFCGSRSLSPSLAGLVGRVVAAVQASGAGVAVGCARGADQAVRQAAPGASVFQASAFGSGRGSFAARSAALVRAVAASGPGAQFIGFVSSPCPAGVVPARSWRSGSPVSGSWSSLALAAGLGVSVVVFWCGRGAPVLPSWPGGRWVRGGMASVADVVCWCWQPAQSALF